MSNDSTPAMGNGTNVRFDEDTRNRVEKLAKKHRLKKADLIRNALQWKLPEWERDGVRFATNTAA